MPKGVVISHGAMAQAVHGYLHQFEMDSETTMMSFLPLAHIYEVSDKCLGALRSYGAHLHS